MLINLNVIWEGGSLFTGQDALSSWEVLWEEMGRPWGLVGTQEAPSPAEAVLSPTRQWKAASWSALPPTTL